MADEERPGTPPEPDDTGVTGRKPLPKATPEFEDLDDSFSESGSSFFAELERQNAPEPAAVRAEPEDFGFDDISTDLDDAPPPPPRGRGRGGRSRSGGSSKSRGGSGGSGGGGRGGARRAPRGGGAASGPLGTPLARVLIAVLFIAIVVIVLALLVRDCRRSQLVDSYKNYVNESAQVAEESSAQGAKLLAVLQNTKGQNATQLQTQVRQLAAEARGFTTRAEDLSPPGSLKDADAAFLLALQYRANGLNSLAEGLPGLIRSTDDRFAANGIADSMQRFLASDVILKDSYIDPTAAALRDQSISGVVAPDPEAVSFLKGGNDRLATSTGSRTLLQPLRRSGGTTGNTGTGNLRGTRLVSTVAQPSGTTLTAGTPASVPASADLQWRVTVLNGGDFVENNVKVTATLTYPSSASAPADVQEATIASIDPGKQATVTVKGPPQESVDLGTAGSLRIEVAPVTGESNTQNNQAEYPITITFS